MANQSITQSPPKSQIALKSGKVLQVPAGADPEAFRRFAQAKEDRRNRPAKKIKSRRTRTYRRRTLQTTVPSVGYFTQREAQGKGIVEAVKRSNKEDDDDTESILLSTIGLDESNLHVLEVIR